MFTSTMARLSIFMKDYLALHRKTQTQKRLTLILESCLFPTHQTNWRLHLTPHPGLACSPPFCFLLSHTDCIQVFASGSASWQWNLTNMRTCFFLFLLLFLCLHWLSRDCEVSQTCSTCLVGRPLRAGLLDQRCSSKKGMVFLIFATPTFLSTTSLIDYQGLLGTVFTTMGLGSHINLFVFIFIEHQELPWNFLPSDIWFGQWPTTSGNKMKSKINTHSSH